MVRQIRQAIRSSRMSLAELERRTGVDRSRLSRFLRGERSMTLKAAALICEALGLRLRRSQDEEWARSAERTLTKWMEENPY